MTDEIVTNIHSLSQWFVKNNQSLSFAESCTGGLLSSFVASQAGVSKFYIGSVVSYAALVKEELLNVSRQVIEEQGEVSEVVAQLMSQGVRQRLHSDWSAAITGIAGPSGGSAEKPVGTVCFAVSGPGFDKSCTKRFASNERQKIQLDSAQFALEFLLASIHS